MSDSAQTTHQDQPPKQDWLILGMDGWIVGALGIVVTIVLALWGFKAAKQRVIQRRLRANGSVAGGAIGNQPRNNASVLQEDIAAGGDIAGGNINRPKR